MPSDYSGARMRGLYSPSALVSPRTQHPPIASSFGQRSPQSSIHTERFAKVDQPQQQQPQPRQQQQQQKRQQQEPRIGPPLPRMISIQRDALVSRQRRRACRRSGIVLVAIFTVVGFLARISLKSFNNTDAIREQNLYQTWKTQQHQKQQQEQQYAGAGGLRGGGGGRSDRDIAISTNMGHPRDHARSGHLVVVAGHSVLRGGVPLTDLARDTENTPWLLLDYQRNMGLPYIMLEHMRAGVELIAEDENAILIFSGGQTRRAAGPISEALSYFWAAQHEHWWGHADSTVRSRTFLEEHATDSIENVLHSLCRFKEVTGHLPLHLSVVSFAYKRPRFQVVVRDSLRWPMDQYNFVGLDPPAEYGFDVKQAEKFEQVLLEGLSKYPYGCGDPDIDAKRLERNPFKRTEPFALACPSLSALLNWCGVQLYHGPLPWDEDFRKIGKPLH